ncbi:hypothetical protein GCM10008097_11010 [Mycetocola manganoxydans]|nr:hypothetical protein GCM10008097_11010 [Mycetocola manganoxydans]
MIVATSTISGAPIDPDTVRISGKFAATTVIGAAAAITMKTIPGTPSRRFSVVSKRVPCVVCQGTARENGRRVAASARRWS